MSTLLKCSWIVCLSAMVGAETISRAAEAETMCSVNKLLGMNVENTAGDKIGDIREVVLTPEKSQVAYLVVGVGGIVGIGERFFAVPISEFTFQEDRVLLSVQSDQLKDRDGFDREHWPKSAPADWMASDRSDGLTGKDAGMKQADTIPAGSLWAHRASKLIGLNVVDEDGDASGDLEDFILNKQDGKIKYAVISTGGVLGVNSELSAVPVQTLRVIAEPREVRFSGDQAKFKSTRIIDNDVDQFIHDPEQQQGIDDQFQELNWTIGMFTADPGLQAQTPDNTEWAADSSYNRRYDVAAETTIVGTVDSTGVYYPGSSRAEEGLRLRVLRDNGGIVTVHVGPSSYAEELGIRLKRGDKITVIGSKVGVEGSHVIYVRQLEARGKTYDLRNSDGEPLWSFGSAQGKQDMPEKGKSQAGREQSTQPSMNY